MNIQAIKEKAINKEIIAFDCFDTVVHRTCSNEETLFRWAKIMSAEMNFQCSADCLYTARKQAERRGKQIPDTQELTYRQLILDTCHIASIKDSERFLKVSTEREIAIERECLKPDTQCLQLIHALSVESKRMILISDFYFGQDMLIKALEETGVPDFFDSVFVSADYNKRKSSGALYSAVLQEMKVSADGFLMIGDNPRSDYEVPVSIGMDAIQWEGGIEKQSILSRHQIGRRIQELTRKGDLYLGGYLPVLLLFSEQLYRRLKQDGVKHVLFCSREGQRLKQIFDLFQSYYPQSMHIHTEYFYASRKSTVIASFKPLDEEEFQAIFKPEAIYEVQNLLLFLSMDQQTVDAILAETGLNPHDVIHHLGKPQPAMQKLKECRIFTEAFNRIYRQQRTFFLQYISQFGIDFETDGFSMVDIGWIGSIQDNIREILPESIEIRGYYLGILESKTGTRKCISSALSKKMGILFTNIENIPDEYYIFRKNFMFLEQLFSADHGPAIGYRQSSDGKVYPVLNNSENELSLYHALQKHWEVLLNSYRQALLALSHSPYTAISLHKYLVRLYAWEVFVIYPMHHDFYQRLNQHVRENYIKNKNDKKRRTLQLLAWSNLKRAIKVRYDKYFDFNKRYWSILSKYKILRPFVAMCCRCSWLFVTIRYQLGVLRNDNGK